MGIARAQVNVTRLREISIYGFKSIRALERLTLANLNVLIGANGAGKSNFVSLFRMLSEMLDGRLQLFVKSEDGPDALLFGGRKKTSTIGVEVYFGRNGYEFE
ncbi:MAG TPA: AAA family ATPase, partial [Thermoanaerobaculia bacterium]